MGVLMESILNLEEEKAQDQKDDLQNVFGLVDLQAKDREKQEKPPADSKPVKGLVFKAVSNG
jgi:hypothetical protein